MEIVMFIRETKETNSYIKKSKFGKFSNYTRTKTLCHWSCDYCGVEFTKNRNGKYDKNSKSYCKTCISKIGLVSLAFILTININFDN